MDDEDEDGGLRIPGEGLLLTPRLVDSPGSPDRPHCPV